MRASPPNLTCKYGSDRSHSRHTAPRPMRSGQSMVLASAVHSSSNRHLAEYCRAMPESERLPSDHSRDGLWRLPRRTAKSHRDDRRATSSPCAASRASRHQAALRHFGRALRGSPGSAGGFGGRTSARHHPPPRSRGSPAPAFRSKRGRSTAPTLFIRTPRVVDQLKCSNRADPTRFERRFRRDASAPLCAQAASQPRYRGTPAITSATRRSIFRSRTVLRPKPASFMSRKRGDRRIPSAELGVGFRTLNSCRLSCQAVLVLSRPSLA